MECTHLFVKLNIVGTIGERVENEYIKRKWFKLIKRLVFGSACDSESYVKYLKGKGIKIGEGTIIYEPTTCSIDIQNPKLLTIGDNVRITSGVKILTHDYSWSVLAGVYGEYLWIVGDDDLLVHGILNAIMKKLYMPQGIYYNCVVII